MTAAILAILAALIPLICFLIKRHITNDSTPAAKQDASDRTADAAVAKGAKGLDDVNLLLESGLRRHDLPPGGSNPPG